MKQSLLFLLAILLGFALAVSAQVSDPPVDQTVVALVAPSADGADLALPGSPAFDNIQPVHGGSFGFLPTWTPPVSIARSFGGSAGDSFTDRSKVHRSWLDARSVVLTHPIHAASGDFVPSRARVARCRPSHPSALLVTGSSHGPHPFVRGVT